MGITINDEEVSENCIGNRTELPGKGKLREYNLSSFASTVHYAGTNIYPGRHE